MNKNESIEPGEYVALGSRLRDEVGGQSQYLTRYFDRQWDGKDGYVYLGEGLRTQGLESGDWHAVTIHAEDVEEAISRLAKIKGKIGKQKIVGGNPETTANLPDWLK